MYVPILFLSVGLLIYFLVFIYVVITGNKIIKTKKEQTESLNKRMDNIESLLNTQLKTVLEILSKNK